MSELRSLRPGGVELALAARELLPVGQLAVAELADVRGPVLHRIAVGLF